MKDYTNKEITDFLRDANLDLGANKYSGDEMIPDYCKAVIIGQQLQAELKMKQIIELEAKEMTDDEAKKSVRAAASILSDAVLSIIQDDPHGWGKRPCDSCQIVSSIIGKPFGCYEYQARNKKGQS